MPTYTPIKHQIASLYSEVEAHGWATGTIDIHHLISWSSHFGWDQVSNRRNAGDVDQLVPLTESDAPRRTMKLIDSGSLNQRMGSISKGRPPPM